MVNGWLRQTHMPVSAPFSDFQEEVNSTNGATLSASVSIEESDKLLHSISFITLHFPSFWNFPEISMAHSLVKTREQRKHPFETYDYKPCNTKNCMAV